MASWAWAGWTWVVNSPTARASTARAAIRTGIPIVRQGPQRMDGFRAAGLWHRVAGQSCPAPFSTPLVFASSMATSRSRPTYGLRGSSRASCG